MADLDAIEALPVVGWYVAGDDGDRVPMLASDRDALVAVVRAAERYRQCAMVASGGDLPEADDLADEAFDALCIALAPFRGADA